MNHMDIAPRHAGVVMGVSNAAGMLAGAASACWFRVWRQGLALIVVLSSARAAQHC